MSMYSTLIRIGIFSLITVVFLIGASTIGITQQEEERTIEKQAFSNEPVKITVVKTKKGVIKLGEKFNDETDWFKGLTVIVENVSDKPVTYVRVGVVFPRPSGVIEGYPYGDSIAYGVNLFSPEGSIISNQAKAIAPGKSVALVMPDEAYRDARVTLKSLKFPESIKRIELIIEVVGFDDGTAWSGGQLWQRDPNAPRGWSPIKKLIGSALNGTATFLRIGSINSKANILGLFHVASLMEPLPIQTQVQCGQVSHEYYSQCGNVVGCRYYDRDFYGETGFGPRVEVYRINQRCRMPNDSFCEPESSMTVLNEMSIPSDLPFPLLLRRV